MQACIIFNRSRRLSPMLLPAPVRFAWIFLRCRSPALALESRASAFVGLLYPHSVYSPASGAVAHESLRYFWVPAPFFHAVSVCASFPRLFRIWPPEGGAYIRMSVIAVPPLGLKREPRLPSVPLLSLPAVNLRRSDSRRPAAPPSISALLIRFCRLCSVPALFSASAVFISRIIRARPAVRSGSLELSRKGRKSCSRAKKRRPIRAAL
jgi:hypothetical protein